MIAAVKRFTQITPMTRNFAEKAKTVFQRVSALSALIFLLASPAAAQSLGRVECAAIPSALMHQPVRYCALLPPGYDTDKAARYPVLYWLHGIGGNEQMYTDGGGWNLVQHLRESKQIGEFIIVTPDGGSTFFANSRDGKRPYEDFFIREFIPAIERKYRVRAGRQYRGISGASMGGYGALHMAFKHPALFGSVSAHSAALFQALPKGSFTSGVVNPQMRALERTFGNPFDQHYWDANNPLELARTVPLAGMRIYFDCGRQDDYGFDAGAVELDKELTARKIPHEFHLDPGGHDWVYFVDHLPKALVFHWTAFNADTRHPPSAARKKQD